MSIRRNSVNAVVARAEPSADLATILTNVVDAIELVAGKDIEKATVLLKETKPMINALDSTGGGGGAGTIPDKEPITEPTTTGVKEPESTIVSDDIM